MKKLLLLLIIPILSFGQDNFDMSLENIIWGLFFLFLALGQIWVLFKVSKYLFGKGCYWYYWRFWNPFLHIISWKGYTESWIMRWLFVVFFFLFAYWTNFPISLLPASLFVYGIMTFFICKENDTEAYWEHLKDMKKKKSE